MKSRRIIFTVEVESNELVKLLKENFLYGIGWIKKEGKVRTKIIQIGTNVVKSEKQPKRGTDHVNR